MQYTEADLPTDPVERKKFLNKLKAKRNYTKHREEIRAKQLAYQRRMRGQPPPEEVPNLHKINYADKPSNAILNGVNQKYYVAIDNIPDIADSTRTFMRTTLKAVMILLGDNDLHTFMQARRFIPLLERTDYSPASKEKMTVVSLQIINSLGQKLTEKVFQKYRDYIKTMIHEKGHEVIERMQNDKVMSFKEYLDTIAEKYGRDSKMFLIASLYDEAPMRDDMHLKIILRLGKQPTENYLVLHSKNGRYTLVFTKYKTAKEFGTIKIPLSQHLTDLIKSYMETHSLGAGDYLFPEEKLTAFISAANRDIGINGAINMFRHMKITDMASKVSSAEMIELSKKMGHTPMTQLSYMRNLVLPPTETQNSENN